MKIYFDTCCYCRPFDNKNHLAQSDVQWEITSILDVIRWAGIAEWSIVGSAAIIAEIGAIKKNLFKRDRARGFYDETVSDELTNTPEITKRGEELTAAGLSNFDPYHVAFAEAANVDFFLTTDQRLVNGAERLGIKVKVINPTNFLEEYVKWLQKST